MDKIEYFKRLTQQISKTQLPAESILKEAHPFELRDLYSDFPPKVRSLFDDGHYAEATFEACKFLDNFVWKQAPKTKPGARRMMEAFAEDKPLIQLTPLSNESEVDEQKGYKFLFAGTMIAIRNPRGHQDSLTDDPSMCLDHLSLVSSLLRRLNMAGYS